MKEQVAKSAQATAAGITRAARTVGVNAREIKTIALIFALIGAAVFFANKVEYSIVLNVSNVKPSDEPTTDDLAVAALPYYMQPPGPAAAPTPADILGKAASVTPNASRERLAGIFGRALGKLRETRISNVDELNDYLGHQTAGGDAGSQGFLQAFTRIFNELIQSGQLDPNNAQQLSEAIGGVEQILRGQ